MRSFHLRAPESLFEKLERLAAERGRSVNSEIRVRLEESLGPVAPKVELSAVSPPLPTPRVVAVELPPSVAVSRSAFRPDFKKIKPKK